MCQVILVSLYCIKTAVPYWTVWIETWEFRKLLWRLLWIFCRHVWRLTKQFVFRVFVRMSRKKCDDMWVFRNMWWCPKKNVSAKFGHVSGLFLYVYVIHNCLNFSRNSAKNLKILLKNSILCSKLKYSRSLMQILAQNWFFHTRVAPMTL